MMYDPTLDDFIAMLKSDNPDERRNAAWMLGRQRDILCVPPLIHALNDPDHDVRLRVAEALGNLRDERAVMPLITALGDDSEEIRAQVIQALGKQHDYRALPSIIPFLNDTNTQLRASAAQALIDMPDPSALPALLHTFLTDSEHLVQYLSRQALSKIGGESLLNALLLELNGDHSAGVIIEIIEILAGLGDARALPAIEKLTTHDDNFVRETAVWATKRFS